MAIGPVAYIAFGSFAIVAASNGVNITDGLDGLAGGTTAFAFVAYMIIALLNIPHQPNLALLCAIVIGATMGFLWFNVHPAQVFMGDSGSLSLGALLAVTALITGQILVLPLIGLVFVLEAGSVLVQVSYFKVSGGKRIFRMSPIHHHFELLGWHEEKITIRFWIVGRPGRAPRGHPLPRLDQRAGLTMPTDRPTRPTSPTVAAADARPIVEPDELSLEGIRNGALRGLPVTVLGFARSGIALARFLVDAGATVTVYDGRPADDLRGSTSRLDGRSVRLLAGPEVDPGAGRSAGRPW